MTLIFVSGVGGGCCWSPLLLLLLVALALLVLLTFAELFDDDDDALFPDAADEVEVDDLVVVFDLACLASASSPLLLT